MKSPTLLTMASVTSASLALFASIAPARAQTRPASQTPASEEAARKAALLPPPPGLPALGPAKPIILPPVIEKTLPNGLKLVILEDHKQPVAFMRLALPAGSIRDPKGKTGVAEMTAALLDKGTETRTEDQIAGVVDTLGASLNAGASDDYLTVSASGLSNQADALVELMADTVLHSTFPDAQISRYKARTLSGIQAALGQPATVATAALARVVYRNHPYGNFSSGVPETVQALTQADAQAFQSAYFVPNGSTLFFAGDITPAQAEALATKYLGAWARKPLPSDPLTPLPAIDRAPQSKPRIFVIDRPGAAQTEIRIGLLTTGYSDPKRITSNVAATVLGAGQFEGRLTKEIRVKRGLTYGVGSAFARQKEAGEFFVSTFTKNASTGEVIRLALGELAKLQKTPPPVDELSERKNFLTGTFGLSVSTPAGLLSRLIPAVLYGGGPSDLTMYTRNVASVTPASVTQTFSSLPLNRAQIVLVGDNKAIAKQLVGLGTVTVIPQEQLDLQSASLRASGKPTAQTATNNQAAPQTSVAPAPAASAEDAQAGRALLDAAIKAHGGDAFLAVKSFKATGKGELTPPGDSGLKVPIDSLVLTTAPGGKTRLDLTTGFGQVIAGVPGTDKTGWLVFGGQVRDQPGAGGLAGAGDPTALLRDAASGKYPVRTVPTTQKTSDGKALKALELTLAGNKPTTLFVEDGTNVLRRIDSKQGGGTATILLGGYKNAGNGVQLPGTIVTLVNGQEVLNLTLDTFELNPTVSDSIFAKPAP